MPLITSQQQRAIDARGHLLVMAGAGTGKTRTLVERCLGLITRADNRVALDQVLLVTFTEAAAAEMRKRIRQRLEEAAAGGSDRHWLAEQLALVETAPICTLHSYCLRLLRDHFHELALDPEFAVLEDAQRLILAGEVFDTLMERHYAGTTPTDRAVQELVLAYGGGRHEAIRDLVTNLHEFVRTLPEPEAWLRREAGKFGESEPRFWRERLQEGLAFWRAEWTEELSRELADHPKAGACLARLNELDGARTSSAIGAALRQLGALDGEWPRGKKTVLRKPLEPLFDDVAFLASLFSDANGGAAGIDPLAEDWEWVRTPMRTLVMLTEAFGAALTQAKREMGVVDFQDLEQFALRLLWDESRRAPTPLALSLREGLEHVFVDEYQDVNAAQDRIIVALSRDGDAANRFIVGDIKQSIYRFRLANPHIFQRYAREWGAGTAGAGVVALSENFRSHETVLRVINRLFAPLMRGEVGGVTYDEAAWLRFGDPESRQVLAHPVDPGPTGSVANVTTESQARVELHVQVTTRGARADADGGEGAAGAGGDEERTQAEAEAALIVTRLRELRESGYPVWSPEARAFRPVEWRDMVILLRSPRGKAEAFAKIFERAGVPLLAARRGLYDALEVSDLLNLLMLLDNPLQDIPVLAVLRSPLVGLGVEALALIRLEQREGEYWTALKLFHRRGPGLDEPASAVRVEAWRRVDRFLDRYERWRRLARRGSLSPCLETVLDETHYESWLEVQPRGAQRRANVRRLLALTRQFDRFQRQGLYRFLSYVEAQKSVEYDPEPAAAEAENAVRLMSIHQSKGLEFPIVVVADLAKGFNYDDTRGAVLLDEELGLCPMVRPPVERRTYPSAAHWLASRQLERELVGEEIRLLYVAATRACDRLVLVGSVTASRVEKGWPAGPGAQLTPRQILDAGDALGWVGRLMPQLTGDPDWLSRGSGQRDGLTWVRHDEPASLVSPSSTGTATPDPGLTAEAKAQMASRLAWRYAHPAATREPAKNTVTALRRRAVEVDGGEARQWFSSSTVPAAAMRGGPETERLSSAERGTAHHRFLELAELGRLSGTEGVRAEAARLVEAGGLTEAEAGVLEVDALVRFWTSPLGTRIREAESWVRRELEFTVRFTPAELASAGVPVTAGLGADEAIVVQGVVDLAVLAPEAILVVDFKTDAVTSAGVAAKVEAYRPQLRLYALALERIHGRPVSEAWLHFLATGETVAGR